MVSQDLYLPFLVTDVVDAANGVFNDREIDPFNIYFKYGIYQDVSKILSKDTLAGNNDFPLVYLVMHIEEKKGRRLDVYSEASIDLFILMPTEAHYTMNERENLNFFPRLDPIYEELINQFAKSKVFITGPKEKIVHTKIDRFYWGGEETGNVNTKNMFERFIDAVQIKGLELKVREIGKNC